MRASSRASRFVVALTVACSGWVGLVQAQPAYFAEVGYTDLIERLTAASLPIPTGAGIAVAQIEASGTGNKYLPGAAALGGRTLVDHSGGGAVLSHATSVGRYFYGDLSMASGISVVHSYKIVGTRTAGDWYGPGYLNTGTSSEPLPTYGRIQNHSWVGSAPINDPIALDAIRRFDYAIKRDNFVAVVGVHNSSIMPELMANAYNAIAVGLSNGKSSIGPTTIDGAGRSKPDIVVPLGATSYATPVVSAAAALLLEVADSKSDPWEATFAGRAETIKAALMAGATKDEFASLDKPWTRDFVTVNGVGFLRPLDSRFGAGELNIDNSHKILSANRQDGTDGELDDQYGWDHQTLSAGSTGRTYLLQVPHGATDISLSAVVTWMRDVPWTGSGVGQPAMANIHLKLYLSNSHNELVTLIDQSVSPIDNVQHIFTTHLQDGKRYAIEVSLASLPIGYVSEHYSIAWMLNYTGGSFGRFYDMTATPEPEHLFMIGAAVAVGLGYGRKRCRPCGS